MDLKEIDQMANQITFTVSCENAYYITLLLYLIIENKITISDEAIQYAINYINNNFYNILISHFHLFLHLY